MYGRKFERFVSEQSRGFGYPRGYSALSKKTAALDKREVKAAFALHTAFFTLPFAYRSGVFVLIFS